MTNTDDQSTNAPPHLQTISEAFAAKRRRTKSDTKFRRASNLQNCAATTHVAGIPICQNSLRCSAHLNKKQTLRVRVWHLPSPSQNKRTTRRHGRHLRNPAVAVTAAAGGADEVKHVLDHHVPDELDGDLDEDEVDDDYLQPRGVRVRALRAQDVEQLPEYALRRDNGRRNRSERGRVRGEQ